MSLSLVQRIGDLTFTGCLKIIAISSEIVHLSKVCLIKHDIWDILYLMSCLLQAVH